MTKNTGCGNAQRRVFMKRYTISDRIVAVALVVLLLLSMAGCRERAETGLQDGPNEDGTVLYQPSEGDGLTAPTSSGTDGTNAAPVSLGGFAVSSSSAEATWTGMQVLSSGGNAVDAAVAISLTLSVTEPYSSGLGGSGIMLVYDAQTGEGYTLDYYCSAGSAASPSDEVAVPGLLAGMQEALDRWGTVSLADAIQPAIDYAEKGFTATETFISRLHYSDSLRNNPAFSSLKVGDLLVQSELAETLKTIQSEGIGALYGGSIGQEIADKTGLTIDDLKNYEVFCSDVVESTFYDYHLIGAYAPTSSMTVCQMLKIAELLDIPSAAEDPNGFLQVIKTASMTAYDCRVKKLVDPRFYEFGGNELVSDAYVQTLLGNMVKETEDDPEKMSTTQFSVIDSNGLTVCVTNTLSDTWGSFKRVGGFYLNNSLSNFSSSGKNAYEPGKRPRTHFAPIIAVGAGGEILAIGSPGGVYIPKIVAGVLIDILKEGEDVQTAVNKARVLYNSNGKLCVETDENAPSIIDTENVSESFYYNTSHIFFGCTSVVGYKPGGGIISVCDRRRETSQAMVYYY